MSKYGRKQKHMLLVEVIIVTFLTVMTQILPTELDMYILHDCEIVASFL